MTNLRQAAQQALKALTCCEAMDRNAEQQKTQAITALRTALEQPEQEPVRMPCVGKDPRCPCQDGDACHYKDCGNTKARPVPQAEPTPWRDMVVVTLVREGINKHKARELADHFAAQQQAEPVANEWAKFLHYPDCWDMAAYPTLHDAVHEALAWSGCSVCKPEQQAEPVAWTTMPEAEDWCFVSGSKDPTGKLEGKWFPLYATPPQRPWVGLTDDEIETIYAECNVWDKFEYERMLEAKLKERNNG